jgi:hypothetical protein
LALVGLFALGISSPQAWGDGTETLGPASIPIAPGSGITAAGTGMFSQPGTVDVTVPAGADVHQVILYWEGFGDIPDDTIMVNGFPVVGQLIGGPFLNVLLIPPPWTYRADITVLDMVQAGFNSLTLDGMLFSPNPAHDGAGVLVIYDDGSGTAEIQVRDGLDYAFEPFPWPLESTALQTLSFPPSVTDRSADLSMFFGAAEDGRPDAIEITVDGDTTTLQNQLVGSDGTQWDTLNTGVDVPAGATDLSVQVFSRGDGSGATPDSIAWNLLAMSLSTPKECWLTGGGVKFEPVVDQELAEHGPKDTLGGVVHPSCSARPADGGNWNHIAHRLKLHFQGRSIPTVNCGNVPGIDPGSESPVTPVNFIEFEGTGRLKGIHGNKVDYDLVYFFARAEDRNEPGNEHASAGEDIDKYFLHVFADPGDPEGTTLLLIDVDGDPATVDPITITGGNLQMHASSCEELGF